MVAHQGLDGLELVRSKRGTPTSEVVQVPLGLVMEGLSVTRVVGGGAAG
jgi:hypothetical protein